MGLGLAEKADMTGEPTELEVTVRTAFAEEVLLAESVTVTKTV